MTSSLVGSEMCIRDSPLFVDNGKDSLGHLVIQVGESPVKLGVEDLQRPVSYTHLTLPTICSV
eukprot:4138997-Prorocentrum_lima.AAC.1